MKKFFLALCMIVFFAGGTFAEQGGSSKFEYKIVPLGSLTSLQKSKNPAEKTSELEEILNKYGAERWEIAEIFAVRTTFDPNVFYVIMKRRLD